MKKYLLLLIISLMISLLSSCIHTPKKIEKYIKKQCYREMTDTCYVDLRKALKTNYDTMYVFNSLIPLTGVQNILGLKDYRKCKSPETSLIGNDSEMCRIVLVKNNRVVYEDEYYYNHYNTKLFFQDFSIVIGQGIFDGNTIEVRGYMCTDFIFKAIKTGDNNFLVKKI